MNKRIAIAAVVALLASLAFATVASASDGFEDGEYTIFLPGAAPVEFTITDGGFASDNPFSDDDAKDEIRITSGDIEIEIDADDAKIEISGLTAAEAAMVTVAFGEAVYSQENLPEDWEISFDDDARSDDHDSVDDDARSDDDDSESTDDDSADDDALSEDDDSSNDDALSEDDDSGSDDTRATTADDDDSESADDDSADDDNEDDDSVDDDDDSESTDDDSADDGSED